jgi:hypothetical protein
MLAMLQRRRLPAVAVTGYAEASWNIGYCGTCSECVTGVRIYYRDAAGTAHEFDEEYSDLGALIRELTDDPAEVVALDAVAVREPDDLKWERYYETHRLSDALKITEVGGDSS